MKIFLLFVFSIVSILLNGVDYSRCSSPSDVLFFETQELNEFIHKNESQQVMKSYVTRGETYLLLDQFDNALEDFISAEKVQGQLECEDLCLNLKFRMLFGEIIAFANLGHNEYIEELL